jgi:mRNA interferase MazF
MRAMPEISLIPGAIVWADLDPVQGREQGGRRPLLVVSSDIHLELVTRLVSVIPITSKNRHWPNHIAIASDAGLGQESWAMTEQVRTISRERISSLAGTLSARSFADVRLWLGDFLGASFSTELPHRTK